MENKYYTIKDSFVKVENFYQQEDSAAWIVEISDWASCLNFNTKFFFGKNRLVLIGYNDFLNKKEITEDEFNNILIREIKDLSVKCNLGNKNDIFAVNFNQTNERRKFLQSFLKKEELND